MRARCSALAATFLSAAAWLGVGVGLKQALLG